MRVVGVAVWVLFYGSFVCFGGYECVARKDVGGVARSGKGSAGDALGRVKARQELGSRRSNRHFAIG